MNREDAKKLQSGDKILIKYPWATLKGTIIRVGRYYVYYHPNHLAPPNQRAKFEFVERRKE